MVEVHNCPSQVVVKRTPLSMIHEGTQGKEESSGRWLSQEANIETQDKDQNHKQEGKPNQTKSQQTRQLTSPTTRNVES
jgi:hypothetical protein